MADAQSVWNLRKIVESSAEFLCRQLGVSRWEMTCERFPVNVELRRLCNVSMVV